MDYTDIIEDSTLNVQPERLRRVDTYIGEAIV